MTETFVRARPYTDLLVPSSTSPDDADVEFYRKHGWWVSAPIVEHDLLDAASRALPDFFAGRSTADVAIPPEDIPQPPHKPGVRSYMYAFLQRREFRALSLHPQIGAICARLGQTDLVRLWHDQLIYKPPARTDDRISCIGWHTDGQYWGVCSSTRMLTAWVPLHDVSIEAGPLLVLDASHRWSHEVRGKSKDDGYNQNLAGRFAELNAGRGDAAFALTLKKGQVSFHHMASYHASAPNVTDVARVSLTIHVQDADNRYSNARHLDGSPVGHSVTDLVGCDGMAADFSDATYCPQIWPVTPDR